MKTNTEPAHAGLVTLDDGAIVDPETGEVVGYTDSPLLDLASTPQSSQSRAAEIKAAVLWATERRANADAHRTGLTTEKNLLIAGVTERYETMIAEQARKVAWIDQCYGAAMREFAKAELVGAKTKSVKLPWATLGYRASKGVLEVTDPSLAAKSLVDSGLASAVTLTVDMGQLAEADPDDADAAALCEALFAVLAASLGRVPGVTASVSASRVPDVLPDGVEGLERKAPEDPLGNFYVSHK